MQRIYYGSLTIDVADIVADALHNVVLELANRRHYRAQPISMGQSVSMPFATGLTAIEPVPGYVNGDNTPTTIALLISAHTPLALAPIERDLPDPEGSGEAVKSLLEWIPDDND